MGDGLRKMAGSPGDLECLTSKTMAETVPVAVVIPTYGRGQRVFETLRRILSARPAPSEIWVHVDQSDGVLEKQLNREFPSVHVLTSSRRLGPGGGRHRCLEKCQAPYAASFDDDSYPVDLDFFAVAADFFSTYPDAAVVGASIWHQDQKPQVRSPRVVLRQSFTGCGCVTRLAAYRATRGYLPRPVPYGGEETDLALLLFAQGWKIYHSDELRVYHNTQLSHHTDPEITAGAVTNIGLYAYLHYPITWWTLGALQVMNMIRFYVWKGRFRGLLRGLLDIPRQCSLYRGYRRPLPAAILREYRRARKDSVTA